jgi:hypothetical protein
MPEPYDHDFWAEVSRSAYELGLRHGWNACAYATQEAKKALAEGRADEQRFWEAVAAAMRLR